MMWPVHNPIFQRECLAAMRSLKLRLALLVLLIVPGLLLFTLWPRTGVFSQLDAQDIFVVFLMSSLALLCCATPVITATAITGEKERRTFEPLFVTCLTPLDIMTGKMLSAWCVVALLLAASMPVTALCALSGGISLRFLAQSYGINLLAVATYSLMGLAVSACCRRNLQAMLVTYLGLLVLAGAVWLPGVLLQPFDGWREAGLYSRSLSPFEALLALYDPALYEARWGRMGATLAIQRHLWGMGGIALLSFVIFCTRILRPHRAHPGNVSQTRYDDRRTGFKRTLRFPFYLIDPLKRKKPIANWRNPVFVAELRRKIFGHPKFMLRALTTCLAVSLGLLLLVLAQYGVFLTPDQVLLSTLLFQFAVVLFFAPLVSSDSLSGERQSGTFEHMCMAPLSAFTLVTGKIKAAFIYVLILVLGSAPVFFAILYIQLDPDYVALAYWFAILLLATLTFAMFGMCASSFMQHTAGATAVSYTFALLGLLGTSSVLLFGDRIAPTTQAAVLIFNPLIAVVQLNSEAWFSDLPYIFNRPPWQNTLIAYAGLFFVILTATAARVHILFNRSR